jgi:SAM-dependent methyltransferase
MSLPPQGPSPERFHAAYSGTPPWDIGRPQPAFVRLEEAGAVVGSVLDVGCGTGENALFLAERGHEVWGVDAVPEAIVRAKKKAAQRSVAVHFAIADALDLHRLRRTFDTVVDSGLFHVFSDLDRSRFMRSLAQVLPAGGTYLMLCFSDQEPGDAGPRRVSEGEIRSLFQEGWDVESVEPTRFETHRHPGGAQALLSRIRRHSKG